MAQEAETVAMELNIVSCQTCDTLFIESERRQTCPACGGLPVGPYLQFVLDDGGLHLKDGAAPAAAPAAPAEELAPEPEIPAAVAVEEEEGEEEPRPADAIMEAFGVGVVDFLAGGAIDEGNLREVLSDMGAEPEAAAIAVGRLAAVRDLLRELAAAGVEAQVEVAAESPPAAAPEPEAEGESGEKE